MLNTEKRRRLIRKFIEDRLFNKKDYYFEVRTNWDSLEEDNEYHCFEILIPIDYNMKNISSYIFEKSKSKCEEIAKKLYPNKELGIIEYKGYFIGFINKL